MKFHELKTDRSVFSDIESGVKTFEYRKNDRNFEVGDILVLREATNLGETGKLALVKVTYLLAGGDFGIPEDYCVMSIKTAKVVLWEERYS